MTITANPQSKLPVVMIKFDLKRALAGHALVTRKGVAVTGFKLRLKHTQDKAFPYECSIDDEVYNADEYTPAGRYWKKLGRESQYDLFMKYEAESKP